MAHTFCSIFVRVYRTRFACFLLEQLCAIVSQTRFVFFGKRCMRSYRTVRWYRTSIYIYTHIYKCVRPDRTNTCVLFFRRAKGRCTIPCCGAHILPTELLPVTAGSQDKKLARTSQEGTSMLPLGSWNFRFLGVSVAGDSRHAEFVRRTIGTASLWRPAISLACRRRTC